MIPKEAIEAAIQAYMKETDSEPHHLEGWFEPAMTAALTAAFAAMSEPVAFRWKYFPEGNWAYDEKTPKEFTLRDPAVIEPLYAAPQPAAVKVKPLKWRVFCSRSGNCEAKTALGEYVLQFEGSGFDASWKLYLPHKDFSTGVAYHALEAAKAAAQANYEACILSATTKEPTP